MISIRRYLILVIISLIFLIAFFAAIHGYRQSMMTSEKVFDAQLKSVSQLIYGMWQVNKNADLTNIALDQNDNLAFQIWQKNSLLYHTKNTPLVALSNYNSGFTDTNFNGQRWRVLVHNIDDVAVMVAQPIANRLMHAENMILSTMTPLILVIPFLAVAIYFIIGNGLSPLNKLNKALEMKKAGDLTEIKLNNVPPEISPIINTLNSLFALLLSSLDRERSFAGDVAHELRTPISVLRIHLHNLISAQASLPKNVTNDDLIADIAKGVERLAHVVEQILKLNRVNSELYRKHLKNINLQYIIQQAISELYEQIELKAQTIAFIGDELFCDIDESSILVLLHNIINNAIKYTPNEGSIEIASYQEGNKAIFTVDDSGQGIPDDEYEKVFSRFYRLSRDEKSSEIGSGLGLAIVKHIVDLHQGEIQLMRSKLGGLQVKVILPLKYDEKSIIENKR